MNKMIQSLKALLQFSTILPLGKPADFLEFSRRSYLYPVAGYVTGGITIGLLFWIVNPIIRAALAVALLLLLQGGNHFDGLLDFGDGLMTHGTPERRIQSMTDRYTGAGGISAGLSVILILFAGLGSVSLFIPLILFGEVGAKFSVEVITVLGKPFREGIHSALNKSSKKVFLFYSALLLLPLILLPVAPIVLLSTFSCMLIIPLVMIYMAYHLFNGVNGDVAGACHEITRALIVMSAAILLSL